MGILCGKTLSLLLRSSSSVKVNIKVTLKKKKKKTAVVGAFVFPQKCFSITLTKRNIVMETLHFKTPQQRAPSNHCRQGSSSERLEFLRLID